MHFLLLVLYGILNRVRGDALLPKVPCYMLFGVLACATAYVSSMSGDIWFWLELWLIAFLGSFFGFMWCWGKYFPNLAPTYDQKCVVVVNDITTKLYVPYTATTPSPQVLNWKTIAMSWRFIIFFAPKYALLAWFHASNGASSQDMMMAFVWCLCLLATVGIIYRICFTIFGVIFPNLSAYEVASSEVLTGMCVIGVCDWIVL